MIIDRKKNAILGTFWGIIQKAVDIVFPFLICTVFIRKLGVEYLGLNSLFTSILQVLNMTELGVSSALVFSMYEPIATDNKGKICALMNLYKDCYRIIGLVILLLGGILSAFLPVLIKGEIPSDVNLYVIYWMNLGKTIISYWLFSYRNSLLIAYQRADIVSIVTCCVKVGTYCLQFLILLTLKNYYVYLGFSIISQVVLNIVIAVITKRIYPDIIPNGRVTKEERKKIFSKVRDLFTAKVANVINHSSDSIIISSFLGIKILALYQNYYFIISTVFALFMVFYNACIAGVGNSLIVESTGENKNLLYNLNHCTFFALNISVSLFVCLCQPFVELWLGEEYLLNFSMVIMFAVYLFAEVVPRALVVFKDAGGMWKEDKWRPLAAAVTNVFMNLALVKVAGLKGILFSTIFSLLVVAFPWLIINVNRNLFEIDIHQFFLKIVKYTGGIIVSTTVSYCLGQFFSSRYLILTLVIRAGICVIFSNVIFFLLFGKYDENQYLMKTIKDVTKKLKEL